MCAQELELHICQQHKEYSKQISIIPMPVQIAYACRSALCNERLYRSWVMALSHAVLTHQLLIMIRCALASVHTWLAKQWLCYSVVSSATRYSQPAVLLPHWRTMPQLIVDLSARGSSQHSRMNAKELPV